GEQLSWATVGARSVELAAELAHPVLLAVPRFGHLLALSDSTGVFEHAKRTAVRREHGYCTDDVARALVVLMREPERRPRLERLAETCLSFLRHPQLPHGRLHNPPSPPRAGLDQPRADDPTRPAFVARPPAPPPPTTPP